MLLLLVLAALFPAEVATAAALNLRRRCVFLEVDCRVLVCVDMCASVRVLVYVGLRNGPHERGICVGVGLH